VTDRPDDPPQRGTVWLDMTRSLTRVGRGAPTGIDRVELAWAQHLLVVDPRARALCRTTRGFLLLGPEGMRRLVGLVRGEAPLGRADALSRLAGRGDRPRHRAEAALRRLAVDRCLRWRLGAMARRHGPAAYLNVGHANLSFRTLGPLRASGCAVAVLVHDLIPIRHPEFVPPDQPASFARKLGTVAIHASVAVAVSDDTRAALEAEWRGQPRRPEIVVAPIGVPEPTGVGPHEPGRFVMVGTLEPRKNHATILAAWSHLAEKRGKAPMPELNILGVEGWKGAEIRRRIEAHPLFGKAIFLHLAAPDDVLADQMRRARALLYPSLAEGFGLPPWEALAHGALPVCSDLPVLRAHLGSHAVYVEPTDVYSWAETITKLMSGKIAGPEGFPTEAPGWQEHFERVSAALSAARDRAERP
jgi:glycosyltransferase involved in cell wall biosynthesis